MQAINQESLVYGQEYLIEHYGPEGLLSKTKGTLHDDGPILYRLNNVVEIRNDVEIPIIWFHIPRIRYPDADFFWLFYKLENKILKRKLELCEAKTELPITVFYR